MQISSKSNSREFTLKENYNAFALVIAQIGSSYGIPYERKTAYYKGIQIVQSAIKEKCGMTVSKCEIKRLVRPNYKKKHVIKFPINTVEILETIIDLVHRKNETYQKCREMNCFVCKQKERDTLLSYSFLIGNLMDGLRLLQGTFVKNSFAEKIFNELDSNRKKCN